MLASDGKTYLDARGEKRPATAAGFSRVLQLSTRSKGEARVGAATWLTNARKRRVASSLSSSYHVDSCDSRRLFRICYAFLVPKNPQMTSNDVPASATGKDTSTYPRNASARNSSDARGESQNEPNPYQLAVQYAEKCNAAIRKLNEAKRARRAAASPGDLPISDDEEEQSVPYFGSVMSLLPSAEPSRPLGDGTQDLLLRDTTNRATTDEQSLGAENPTDRALLAGAGTAEPEFWRDIVSTAVANDPNALSTLLGGRNQVIDYHAAGLLYTREELSKNEHTVDPEGIPNSILQMAHGRAYIPLSMLATTALNRIRSNDNLKYIKVPNSVVKQTLDPTQFGSEEALSYDDWDQAYDNWLLLMDTIGDEDVGAGWRKHRSKMRADQNFS
jgi:hypothetical protein